MLTNRRKEANSCIPPIIAQPPSAPIPIDAEATPLCIPADAVAVTPTDAEATAKARGGRSIAPNKPLVIEGGIPRATPTAPVIIGASLRIKLPRAVPPGFFLNKPIIFRD